MAKEGGRGQIIGFSQNYDKLWKERERERPGNTIQPASLKKSMYVGYLIVYTSYLYNYVAHLGDHAHIIRQELKKRKRKKLERE